MSADKQRAQLGQSQHDTARNVLGVLFIVALIGSSLWILRPFLGAIVWAAAIVVATWPLMISLQVRLWNKRALAVPQLAAVSTEFVLRLDRGHKERFGDFAHG